MTAPMPERQLLKLIKDDGFTVGKSSGEWKVMRGTQYLMSFAIAHKKGANAR